MARAKPILLWVMALAYIGAGFNHLVVHATRCRDRT